MEFITILKEGAIVLGVISMSNPNQPNTSSKDVLITNSSIKGMGVVVHVGPLDPTSFYITIFLSNSGCHH
jgi:hypothetical protein